MTAEIAVLNKLAVTLAADSAVTIPNPDGAKVYNSADKIFEATVFDPIGVMVYNSPELCGVPIETIVKMFRDRHCPGHFPTVFEFAKAFLEHIERLDTPPLTVRATVWSLISSETLAIREALRGLREDFFKGATTEKYPSVDALVADLEAHLLEQIAARIDRLKAMPTPAWAEGLSAKEVLEEHAEAIADYVEAVFDGDDLQPNRKDKIVELLAWSLLKEFQREALTGLVFAGFGQDEIFPSLISFEVYGTIAGKLKFDSKVKFDVDRSLVPDAAAFPFAQKEMVDRFMYGLDSEFLDLCTAYFTGALGSLKAHLESDDAGLDQAAKDALAPALDSILAEFSTQIVPEHLRVLTGQFSDMIRSMPKEELAALAESLVHITSLKRKFSQGAESVGGPIDVAVITRAEGFVWVKRKHYFDAALNPRYFHRQYGGNHSTSSAAGSIPIGER